MLLQVENMLLSVFAAGLAADMMRVKVTRAEDYYAAGAPANVGLQPRGAYVYVELDGQGRPAMPLNFATPTSPSVPMGGPGISMSYATPTGSSILWGGPGVPLHPGGLNAMPLMTQPPESRPELPSSNVASRRYVAV